MNGGSRGQISRASCLHIELEQDHVSVPHHVFLAFHPVESFFPGGRDGAAFDEVVVGHGFGFDETASKIAMDGAGCYGSGVAGVNGPGADFLFAGGEESAQAEQMVGAANQRAHAGFVHAQLL